MYVKPNVKGYEYVRGLLFPLSSPVIMSAITEVQGDDILMVMCDCTQTTLRMQTAHTFLPQSISAMKGFFSSSNQLLDFPWP